MRRTAFAFLVAPLWVPAVTALFAAPAFPHPEQRHWIYITTIVGAIFSYGGVLAFGIPAFLILRARKLTAFWIAPLIGFGVGAGTGLIFYILFALSLGNSLTFIWHELGSNPAVFTKFLLPTGALGALVGTTLWLIARPDREPAT